MKKLGKYEVLGEIGHGAMGVVYRARDPFINRLVALKTITTGVADDPALIERIDCEGQYSGGIKHTKIVQINDMDEERGYLLAGNGDDKTDIVVYAEFYNRANIY